MSEEFFDFCHNVKMTLTSPHKGGKKVKMFRILRHGKNHEENFRIDPNIKNIDETFEKVLLWLLYALILLFVCCQESFLFEHLYFWHKTDLKKIKFLWKKSKTWVKEPVDYSESWRNFSPIFSMQPLIV